MPTSGYSIHDLGAFLCGFQKRNALMNLSHFMTTCYSLNKAPPEQQGTRILFLKTKNKPMNKISYFKYSLFIFSLVVLSSCAKEEGCTDPISSSYSSTAEVDDGSCTYYYGGKNYGQLDVGAEIDLNDEFDIYFDGEFIGRSMYYFPGGLDCGNPQAVGKIVPSGTHRIKAVGNGGGTVIEGNVTVDPQECKVVLLENL
jgi:hypothetical protein